jgi:hypothetical protein
VRPSGTGRKLLHHPQRGSLSFEYSTFQAQPGEKVRERWVSRPEVVGRPKLRSHALRLLRPCLLHHPQRGSLSFEYSTFQANEDPALKLAIYVPITEKVRERWVSRPEVVGRPKLRSHALRLLRPCFAEQRAC